jgi:hypothetical protein
MGRLAARALMQAITKPETPKARLVNREICATTKDTRADCPPEY